MEDLHSVSDQAFLKEMQALCAHHYEHCLQYRRLIDSQGGLQSYNKLVDVPVLMVSVFKQHSLKSVAESEVFKVLRSSGTTGLQSQIYLDRETAIAQSKALVKIVQGYLGNQRYPMVLIDHAEHTKNRQQFNARAAGVQGLSIFGRDHFYALDSDMQFDFEAFLKYLQKYEGQAILFFGFTFMVWAHFVEYLIRHDIKLDLSDSILLHSGGWKKMLDRAVDNDQFKAVLKERLGITRVHNFYGMAEQTGSIFVECENGHLHESDYGKVLIRKPNYEDPKHWPLSGIGEQGLIQVLSTLPGSYPGHSIMTEDLGHIVGINDCSCGRPGKYFQVHGRLPRVQTRGCSDV